MTEVVATIETGRIRGVGDNGVRRFLGVPYAAGPVGDLRFAAPKPHAPWTDTRDATEPGPTAPQFVRPFPGLDIAPLVGAGWAQGDDFLTANIWAPEGATAAPVLVFVHGGAFVLGSNNAAVQDGSGFARSGVVSIAINYRMGVEGFLPVSGAPTNLGLRDIIAALQWVGRNAAAFGGDPANITVHGESAGAMLLADLVASPAAQGLFRRAIIQSGHGDMVRPPHAAARLVKKLARMMKIKPDLAGFRSRDESAGLTAIERISRPTARIDLRDDTGREPAFGLTRFLPVTGDDILPEAPRSALAKGIGADIQVLIGTNREEMNLYFVPTGVRGKLNGFLARMILKKVEPQAKPILKAYGLGTKGVSAGDAFTRALSDLVFRYPARRFAAAHRGRTHMYEMDWRSPAAGGELGACHGIELPFVFDTLPTCTGPEGLAGVAPPQALADRIHGLWVAFARTGELPWREYSTADPQVFALEAGTAAPEPPLPVAAILN